MDADDQNALLLFRVGPVCCCAPSRPVAGVVTPPPLHRPPGSDALHPGVFRHGGHLVKVVDLGQGFGVPIPEGGGRIIVTELPSGRFGFRVDDIIDVLEWPASGWGSLPPPIPRTWFRRTLQHEERLCLYTEFERLAGIEETGILRDHLRALEPETPPTADPEPRPTAACSRPAEPEPRPAAGGTRPPEPGPAPVTPPPGRTESRAVPPPTETVSRRIPDPGTSARNQPPYRPDPAPLGTPGRTAHRSPTAASRPRQPVPPRQAEPPRRSSAPESPAPAGSTPPPSTRPTPAAPKPAAPSFTTTQPTADENPLPALLWIVFVLAGLGAGSWYLLTDWLAPEPARPLAVAPPTKPVPHPGREQGPPESPREPVAADNPPAAPAPALSEPKAPELPEPEPIPARTRTPAPPPPEYRAEIRDDDEGITIVLHQPPSTIPAPQAENGITTPAGTPSVPATAGLPEPAADESVPAEAKETAIATPKPSSRAEAPDTAAPTPQSGAMAPENGASTPSPAPVTRREIVHVVVRGDTLWDIAARYVHDPFRYPELARLSRIRDPDRIYPGDRVRILVVQDP